VAQLPDLSIAEPEAQRIYTLLRGVLQNLSSDNYDTEELVGEVPAADTKNQVSHGLGTRPSFYFILEGDVYVAFNGLTAATIDIRSRNANEKYRLLLVR
jgi:hypothetical protein